ncbi:MAG: 23S rRNA (guanosine(2251)-2'-O)-methyltransferase RlmB [Candidatus Nanopelagicales bacterium]|nr:23S rRNA (guanosine(2251)-2'-O)-methyltransferase RlmB [Candidatus Nanopelagicales bacterium]
MAGNSQRRGATRKGNSRKGPSVGSGGQKRQGLEPKGPTPKAVERQHHPAARRARAAQKRADAAAPRRSSSRRSAGSVLAGRNPVVEALRAGIPASALYTQTKVESDDRWREAMRIAVRMGIPILEVTKVELDRMTEGAVHQGLVLSVPEHQYSDIHVLLKGTLVIALDGVTDPRNLGAIARSAAAFRADGIVIPTRRSVGVTASAWKASAGALARVPVSQVTNLTRSLQDFQNAGFSVVGLAADGDVTLAGLPEAVCTDKLVVVIGAEGTGLGRLVGETCDWRLSIPMAGGVESLNAAVAASIVLQRVYSARS